MAGLLEELTGSGEGVAGVLVRGAGDDGPHGSRGRVELEERQYWLMEIWHAVVEDGYR